MGGKEMETLYLVKYFQNFHEESNDTLEHWLERDTVLKGCWFLKENPKAWWHVDVNPVEMEKVVIIAWLKL